MNYVIAALISYLLGTIHPSYLLAKRLKKIDIRECGSKNAGTSNATIVLGLKFGILTALIDVLKGTFAVLITGWIFGTDNTLLLYVSGLFAVLGHMFPFYMKGRGGKGLATIMGVAIALNFYLAVAMFAVLVLGTALTDYIVVGTVAVCIVFAVHAIATYGFTYPHLIVTLVACLISFGILYKHRVNYGRIYRKEEIKVSTSLHRKNKDEDSNV